MRDAPPPHGDGLCGHAYVTAAGRCHHCNADLSDELAAAVDALNESIARSLDGDSGGGVLAW